MAKCVQIAPHAIALVLSRVRGGPEVTAASHDAAATAGGKLQQQHHHEGYEIFADFKAANMQHFWNKSMVHAVSEVFFLGWIVDQDQDQDQKVLLVQGEEEHLDVLRHGWTRRVLHPPPGYSIKCIGKLK